MGAEALAQGPDLRQLLLNRRQSRAETGLQTNDRLVVEAAPVALGRCGQPGMERVRQVFEGECFGHGSQ